MLFRSCPQPEVGRVDDEQTGKRSDSLALFWFCGSRRHGYCALARPTARLSFHTLPQDSRQREVSGGRVYQNTFETFVENAAASRSLAFIDFTKPDPKAVVDKEQEEATSLGLATGSPVSPVALGPRNRCSYAG